MVPQAVLEAHLCPEGATWNGTTSPDLTDLVVGRVAMDTDGSTVVSVQWNEPVFGSRPAVLRNTSFGVGSWTLIPIGTDNTNGFNDAFTMGGGVFLGSFASNQYTYSTDGGENWTILTKQSETSNSLEYGGGNFMMVGSTGKVTVVAISDLNTPVNHTSLGAGTWILAFGDATWVAFNSTNGAAKYSTDVGVTWTSATAVSKDIIRIRYGNGTFLGVGSTGDVVASYDSGRNWVDVTPLTTSGWTDQVFAQGYFQMVDQRGGTMYTTFNGTTFNNVDPPLPGGHTSTTFRIAADNRGHFISPGYFPWATGDC